MKVRSGVFLEQVPFSTHCRQQDLVRHVLDLLIKFLKSQPAMIQRWWEHKKTFLVSAVPTGGWSLSFEVSIVLHPHEVEISILLPQNQFLEWKQKIPTHKLKCALKYELLWNAWWNLLKLKTVPFSAACWRGNLLQHFLWLFPVLQRAGSSGVGAVGRLRVCQCFKLEVKANCLCFIFYILILICGH